MPQLKSGRHFGLSADLLLKAIKEGSDENIYGAIMAYRLGVKSPADLLEALAVTCYREGEGEPPNAPTYPTGFVVEDVLAGKAGWSEAEVAEFSGWLESNPRLSAWVADRFDEIEVAIRNSPLWSSRLLTD